MLLRFAGTRLAAGDDTLTPTALRRGGRLLGGALSWESPKHIAPFEAGSPFFGLAAPDEVTVSRQVLAEPETGLAEKTWARLADGTPLVTAERRGKGLIVLFHVTADTTWSNLPLSGLFVDMLRRIVAEADAPGQGAAKAKVGAHGTVRPPLRTLTVSAFSARRRRKPNRSAMIFPASAIRSTRPASTDRATPRGLSTRWLPAKPWPAPIMGRSPCMRARLRSRRQSIFAAGCCRRLWSA